jgi:hypothetical protein
MQFFHEIKILHEVTKEKEIYDTGPENPFVSAKFPVFLQKILKQAYAT